MYNVTKAQAQKLIGKHVYVRHKNGTVMSGKLLDVNEDRLLLISEKGKNASTNAIIPLVLFDLLAIGLSPYAYGYGCGYGGCPPRPPYPYGGGYYGGYGPYR